MCLEDGAVAFFQKSTEQLNLSTALPVVREYLPAHE